MPRLETSKKKPDLLLEEKLPQAFYVKDYLENVAFYLLLATIFLAAIPYGTVDLWSKSFLVLIICLIAVIRVLSIFFNGSPLFSNGSLIFPLAGILGLAIIQIVPWANGNFGRTISLDPDSTENFILIFAGLIIGTEILLALTTTKKRLKALVFLVLVVGLGSAVFGVLRVYFLTESQTGLSSYFTVGEGFAQFVNLNHFVYLMEMTVGLLLGLLIKGSLSEKLKFFGWVTTGFIILITILANSRGGIISLTGIFILAAVIYFFSRHKNTGDEENKTTDNSFRKILFAAVLACGVFGVAVLTIAFVGGDAVTTKFESIQSEVGENNEHRVNRLTIWKPTLELIKEKPLTGAGFGGYSAAITKFDKSNGNFSVQQAHNDYLEILANGGIPAFLLFLIFAYIFVSKAVKQFRSRSHSRRSSCFGAILGISGVVLHSVVDFGLHTLLNTLIFIVLIVIATAKISSSDKSLRFVS